VDVTGQCASASKMCSKSNVKGARAGGDQKSVVNFGTAGRTDCGITGRRVLRMSFSAALGECSPALGVCSMR
jgi:hypothetical protein